MSPPRSLLMFLLAAACGSGSSTPGRAPIPRPNPPIVTVEGVALAAAPTSIGIAKVLCPKVANALACRILGSPPSASELSISFDITLAVENPNDIALPAVEALVAFTAYPEAVDVANVGAVCFALCDEGHRCAPPRNDACTRADDGLRSMNDYVGAAAGFLTQVATDGAATSEARARRIGPREQVKMTVRLEVGAQALLALIHNVALDMLDSLTSGSIPSFVIPFQIEGTLWVEVEAFGKISAGFGPVDDRWELK